MYQTPISRCYIDVRPLESIPMPPDSLPLLSTLQPSEQSSITAYLRHPDRLMSLASQLLKYHFIHRNAQIPWSQVRISRWPKPHKRPYWDPPTDPTRDYGLEFNVSHQAGLVALLGCRTPQPASEEDRRPDPLISSPSATSIDDPALNPRLGVDIACPDEARRSPTHIKTQADLDSWVDIFSEMFSERERDEMKYSSLRDSHGLLNNSADFASEKNQKIRRFYAHWSLKEAFIKMTGEGLVAPWLRELEFRDVSVPAVATSATKSQHNGSLVSTATSEIDIDLEDDDDADNQDRSAPQEGKEEWSTPISTAEHGSFKIHLYSEAITLSKHGISMSISAYGPDFLITTAMKGVKDPPGNSTAEQRWIQLDIERDIRPCAEGRCTC